ncbi:MAG TPA: SRPBCC family protein [Acidimicrobiales bacterium]|nr:SRPBCC family protein [Acidimicrobiales bacterium]
MELTNEFRVSVPVERAWAVLTDVERIAPCMPGAELHEVEGDEYRGVVKVKVGPITAQYKGSATFVERDDTGRRAVLRAEGRDTRGQGNANATITATLQPDGDGTRVEVVTDLAVTGKVAQFGRGVLADVSAKLLGQFVERLEADVLRGAEGTKEAATEEPAWAPAAPAVAAEEVAPSGNGDGSAPLSEPAGSSSEASEPKPGGPGPGTDEPAPPSVRRIEPVPAQPVDLIGTAGGSVAKRVGPAVGAVLFLLWVFVRRRRSRRG